MQGAISLLIGYNEAMSAARLLRDSRNRAGLTQAGLARRLGVSQAAVAKLEHPAANPTITTLENALSALGQRLMLAAEPRQLGIDETLVAEQLKRPPAQRLAQLERMYEWGRELTLAGARARGELD
jgi:transcriptional regulator with XRE-family HTH domain